ncbi:MAG: EAL domain-containing protein [Actinomycetota bacterium]
MPATSTIAAPTLGVEIGGIITSRRIASVYQPIVHLDTGAVVGYESLARGPQGARLERPDLLFEAGRSCGRVAELDWLCRAAAVRGALEAGLAAPFTLFVNVESDALHAPMPHELKPMWLRAKARLRVMLEITERALTGRPRELLWSVEWARELGWGVALDDVGADPRSLALLPFLRPDVIKLDLNLMQDDGPDGDRRFDYSLTHDREIVTKIALSLMARVIAL